MKHFLGLVLALITLTAAHAQKDSTQRQPAAPVQPAKKDWSKIDLSHRANDHFMVQIAYDGWLNQPDTLTSAGISRSFNFYFMYDFPFKTDPHLSVGAGIGIGCSNMFFKSQPAPLSALPRAESAGGEHFKKYKVVTTYLEIPLELRYAMDPENTNKSWKFALGVKVGTMLSAYAKGKNIENSSNQVDNAVTEKVSGRSFYNGIKLAGTARISKGFVGLFGQLQLTGLIKSAYGPSVNPFSVGITLSGL